MFDTDLEREYAIAAELLGLDAAGVADLARTAVEVSFLDAAARAQLLADIDEYADGA
jgi:aminodeoxyfutalosine deaminase